MRFHFSVDSDPPSEDDYGQECADLDDARRFAVQYAGAILKDWAGELGHPGTLLLMRVTVTPANRTEVMQLCDIFRAKIVDVQHEVLGIEVTGNESKIDKFLMLMGKFGISELSRTGRVALARKPN